MTEQEQNLAYQKERDEMHYRERAVELALGLSNSTKQQWTTEQLVHNANVVYCFIKGTSHE